MKHELSNDDRLFRNAIEACRLALEEFDHRAHVRLAYIYLAEYDIETATALMRSALVKFLRHNNIDVSKYHETMTKAWILAVRHFMTSSLASASADEFINNCPILLDSRIMMTHYSADVLFSPEARARFIEPNLDQIPWHET